MSTKSTWKLSSLEVMAVADALRNRLTGLEIMHEALTDAKSKEAFPTLNSLADRFEAAVKSIKLQEERNVHG